VLRATWAAHVEEPERYNCMILGTDGGVTTRPPALYHLRNGTLANEEYKSVRAVNTYEAQMRYFLPAARGERAPFVTEEESMNVQRILNAAYRSAEEGREVAVED
jgi:predicted dehydrogenase